MTKLSGDREDMISALLGKDQGDLLARTNNIQLYNKATILVVCSTDNISYVLVWVCRCGGEWGAANPLVLSRLPDSVTHWSCLGKKCNILNSTFDPNELAEPFIKTYVNCVFL